MEAYKQVRNRTNAMNSKLKKNTLQTRFILVKGISKIPGAL